MFTLQNYTHSGCPWWESS